MSGSLRPSHTTAAAVAMAAALAMLTAAAFYPGYLTWDAAYQWYQVRTGHWDNVHPVIMTAIWSLTDRILPGPGGYFLLQIAAYWSGIAALATGLFVSMRARIAAVALLGLLPPVFALLPQLLKDIGLLVLLIWAIALLAHDARRPSRPLRIGAFAFIALACAYRHNALPLAVPLLWYLTSRELRSATAFPRMIATAGLTAIVAVIASLPNHLPGVAQRQVWPITAIWDLAAVSIDEQTILLPDEITDPDLAVADLERDFVPHAAVPVFSSGKIRDSVSAQAFTPDQETALRDAWLDLWRQHFPDYAAHRARLAELLLGFAPADLPNYLILDYNITPLADNPPVQPADNALQAAWQWFVTPLLDSPMFAFWLYASVLFVIAVSARGRPTHPLLMPIIWSAGLLVLPLLIAAPGADFRFLLWPVFCAALAVALRLTPGHRTPDQA